MTARVIVLAGPSGAGKTRLAERLGLPVVRLDDFYRDIDDPALPMLNQDLADWDHPQSWNCDDAVAALATLCATGSVEVPDYDITISRRTGTHRLDAGGAHFVVAEGIFAHLAVAHLRQRGLLAEAICVTQNPALTFVRRLLRDLAEHRKPPLVLLTRGLRLMRAQPRVVKQAVVNGCRAMNAVEAEAHLRALTTS